VSARREHCRNHARRGLPLERLLSCRHFVNHSAEGEDVRARVGLFSFKLLRRHVLDVPTIVPSAVRDWLAVAMAVSAALAGVVTVSFAKNQIGVPRCLGPPLNNVNAGLLTH